MQIVVSKKDFKDTRRTNLPSARQMRRMEESLLRRVEKKQRKKRSNNV